MKYSSFLLTIISMLHLQLDDAIKKSDKDLWECSGLLGNWHIPFSSSCSACGRTPPWCLHTQAAAAETQSTCISPLALCSLGWRCGFSPSAGTPQTEDLRNKTMCNGHSSSVRQTKCLCISVNMKQKRSIEENNRNSRKIDTEKTKWQWHAKGPILRTADPGPRFPSASDETSQTTTQKWH